MATPEQEMAQVHNKSVAPIPYTQNGQAPQAHRPVLTGANFAAQSGTKINNVNASTPPRESLANNGALHRLNSNSYDVNVAHAQSHTPNEIKGIKKQGGV